MTAIEIENLALRRGGRTVLAGMDAVIGEREFVGIFGPNGAGKTTLLHALLGLVPPAAGTIRVFGSAPTDGNRTIGYLPQRRSSLGDLRLRGWDLVASAYNGYCWGLPRLGAEGRRQVAWALELVEAEALAERPVHQLSGGELQRLLLAQALLGKPKLLLLDEPLISLDPRYQQAVVDMVKRVQQTLQMTVLFTAHELNPLLGAMDRVLYLGHGHAVLGRVEDVMTSEVLSRLYDAPIDVLRVRDRIVVVAAEGAVEIVPHRHDA